jgi:hypothetical protein
VVTATANDYVWFARSCPGLAQAYCLTLVEGQPGDLLRRLDAPEESQLTGDPADNA